MMTPGSERRAAFASVWVFAIAFGWIEATTVVYLRDAALPGATVVDSRYLPYEPTPIVSLPGALVALEIAREAWTVVLLAAGAWLAGRRPADRIGAFFLAFGIWDLTYYAVLRSIVGWPDHFGSWDILFLIPSPWIAPVWAPMTVSALFVIGGSYLFWSAERARHYRWSDIGAIGACGFLTVASFLMESNADVEQRVPRHFPVWLFWLALLMGTLWFVHAERRNGGRAERTRV